MAATFTHYQEFPGVGTEQAQQGCLAAHLALDGPLRDWIALVSPRDPLRPLAVIEGPGQEAGGTGWTIQATDPNADLEGRVHIWMAWHTTLADASTLLGCSRVRTVNPGAYSTLEPGATGTDGTISSSGFSLGFGLPFALMIAASDQPGQEWFTASITQGSLSSRVHSLLLCREQNYGGWLLLPSIPTTLRAMGRQAVAPYEARFCHPVIDRVVLNQLVIPALVTLTPAAAPATLELSPLYRLPADIAICAGHLNPNYYLLFADGSRWLTAARSFAVQIEGPAP
ncbi:MAG: hypothetical protein WBN89_12920 [Prochlorococcaceae cyanobacterium]